MYFLHLLKRKKEKKKTRSCHHISVITNKNTLDQNCGMMFRGSGRVTVKRCACTTFAFVQCLNMIDMVFDLGFFLLFCFGFFFVVFFKNIHTKIMSSQRLQGP